jgi:hypothetical protein
MIGFVLSGFLTYLFMPLVRFQLMYHGTCFDIGTLFPQDSQVPIHSFTSYTYPSLLSVVPTPYLDAYNSSDLTCSPTPLSLDPRTPEVHFQISDQSYGSAVLILTPLAP